MFEIPQILSLLSIAFMHDCRLSIEIKISQSTFYAMKDALYSGKQQSTTHSTLANNRVQLTVLC